VSHLAATSPGDASVGKGDETVGAASLQALKKNQKSAKYLEHFQWISV
jgi:hypothetical protein